jgi:uncharacterized protein DUF3108
MRRMVKRACLLLLAWSLSSVAGAAPKTVSATYDILLNGIHVAVITERFEVQNATYRVTSNSAPIGLFALVKKLDVRFISTGETTAQGLRPRRFEGRRGTSDAIELAADFDWAAGQLTVAHDGKSERMALPGGTQDRLSVMYQFMYLAPAGGQQIDVDVTNGRGLDHYTYQATAGVGQDTPLGRMSTVHLVKQHAVGESENEIWLAPDHGFVPVRMIIVERNGTRYEQLITKLDLS